MNPLPTLFISHGGGPCFWMDWDPPNLFDHLADYLGKTGAAFTPRIKAILVISGHWEEKEFTVNTAPRPPMLFDYSGFPEHTYKLDFPAPGSPEIAQRVKGLLENAGIAVLENSMRGYDHGVFVPFLKMFPEAKIPVAQLSMKKSFSPLEHIKVGQALEPLRNEGVLIIGSGNSYHNLRFSPDALEPSKKFDAWLTEAVTSPDASTRNEKLSQWLSAPHARVAQPREDHLVPLFVAAGAAGVSVGKKVFADNLFGFPNSGYQFGE